MSEYAEISSESVVLRRPHFRLAGEELFFLISRRPLARLLPDEARVWEALGAEEVAVQDLRAKFGERSADAAISRFVELGACDLAAAQFRKGRRRVLVIEPHSDDAILSVGGTMWQRRNVCDFTVATIASRSNFTSYFFLNRDFFSIAEVSALRAEEGALAARLLGGKYIAVGQAEATLRYRDGDWSLDWFREHELSVRTSIERC